jgi:MOSC domain-containing protein YiiM
MLNWILCAGRLGVGMAVLKIAEELDKGCAKFRARFGDDALKLISNEEGRRLNLRGIYAKVVQAGEVSVGDVIRKIGD